MKFKSNKDFVPQSVFSSSSESSSCNYQFKSLPRSFISKHRRLFRDCGEEECSLLHVVPDCCPREIQQFDQEDILEDQSSSDDERPQFDPLWKQNQSLQKEKKLFPETETEEKKEIPVFKLGNNMSFEGEKKVRSTAKAKVTRLLNRIEPLLSSKGEDALYKYLQAKDIDTEIDSALKDLNASHESYCKVTEDAATGDDVEKVINENEKYLSEIMTNVSKIKEQINNFKRYIQSFKDAKEAIPDAKINFMRAKEDYFDRKRYAEAVFTEVGGKSYADLIKWTDTDKFDAETIRDDFKRAASNNLEYIRRYEAELSKFGKTSVEISTEISFDRKSEGDKMKDLIMNLDKLVNAQAARRNVACSMNTSGVGALVDQPKETPIKLDKAENLKFSGQSRDFAEFKRDFNEIVVPHRAAYEVGVRLRQAVPEKHRHLISNIPLHEPEKMMDILENKFGTPRQVVMNVVADLEKLKIVDDDKNFVTFVEKIEKAKRDLDAVNQVNQMSNESIIANIESKLPGIVKKDWIDIVFKEGLNKKSADEKFTSLMKHLSDNKEKAEYQLSESGLTGTKTGTKYCLVTGKTFHINSSPSQEGMLHEASGPPPTSEIRFAPCLACSDGATDLNVVRHNMETCEVWNSLTIDEKKAKVKCVKHPFTKQHRTEDCNEEIPNCKKCHYNNHHHLMCFAKNDKNGHPVSTKSAFTYDSNKVLLKTHVVCGGRKGHKIGVLEDNGSTANYVTHDAANKMNLKGDYIKLKVEGINTVKEIDSKIYWVPIADKWGKLHLIQCYGLDKIASDAILPEQESYNDLCSKFSVLDSQVQRPVQIDLLLSGRSNYLMSDKVVKTFGGMKLFDGPLGKTFSGFDRSLSFPNNEGKVNVKNFLTRATPVIGSQVMHAASNSRMKAEQVACSMKVKDKEILDKFTDKVANDVKPEVTHDTKKKLEEKIDTKPSFITKLNELFLEKVEGFEEKEEEKKPPEERILKKNELNIKDEYLDTGTVDKSRLPTRNPPPLPEDLWHVAWSILPKLIEPESSPPVLSSLGRMPDWKTLSESFQMLLLIMSRPPEKQKIQSVHAGECTKKNYEVTAA